MAWARGWVRGLPAGWCQPVLRMPAAMPFTVTTQRCVRLRVGCRLAHPPQQLDLHQVDRVDVGIAHVDRAAQDRRSSRAARCARSSSRTRARWRGRSRRAQLVRRAAAAARGTSWRSYSAAMRGVGLGQHHLDQLDHRAEVRPLAVHRAQRARLRRARRRDRALLDAEPRAEHQPRLRPRELPRDGPQRRSMPPSAARRAGRLPMLSVAELRHRRRGAEVLDETRGRRRPVPVGGAGIGGEPFHRSRATRAGAAAPASATPRASRVV